MGRGVKYFGQLRLVELFVRAPWNNNFLASVPEEVVPRLAERFRQRQPVDADREREEFVDDNEGVRLREPGGAVHKGGGGTGRAGGERATTDDSKSEDRGAEADLGMQRGGTVSGERAENSGRLRHCGVHRRSKAVRQLPLHGGRYGGVLLGNKQRDLIICH